MAENYTTRTLRELIRIVASRFLGMLIIMVIVVGGVTMASMFAAKWYRSEVQLMASPSRAGNPLEDQSTSLTEAVQLFITTQREIIRSDYVLASALMKLENPGPKNGANWDVGGGEPWFSDKEIEQYILKHPERLRWFKKRVTIVTPGPDRAMTQTFKIRLDWPEIRDPKYGKPTNRDQAAKDCYKLSKYIVKSYLTRFSIIEEQRTKSSAEFCKTSLDAAKKRLDEATQALKEYSEELGESAVTVAGIYGKTGIDSGPAMQMSQLKASIDKIDERLASLIALKKSIDTELAKDKPEQIAVPNEVTLSNPAIDFLQQNLVKIKLRLNTLTPQYTDDYQEVNTLKSELKTGYQDLKNELTKQSARTKYTIVGLQSSRKDLQDKLDKITAVMKNLGGQSIQYSRLRMEVDAATENFDKEQRKYLDALNAEALATNPILVTVLDDPSIPNPADPRRPIVWLNILISVFGGLVLALIYAFLADHFDHTIKSVDEAERYLGTPVISSVPKLGMKIIRTR